MTAPRRARKKGGSAALFSSVGASWYHGLVMPFVRASASFAAVVATALFAFPAAAAPSATEQAVAYVVCGQRQGSGALVSLADGGYVLTVGHVAMDPVTRAIAESCRVGFPTDESLQPKLFYQATVVHAVFETRSDRDIAVLKLGSKISNGPGSLPQPLKTNEFAVPGDALTAHGFPGGLTTMKSAAGKVLSYSRGTLLSDAPISQGYSGGPVVDAAGRLIAIAERVSYEIDEKTGEQRVLDYEFGDIVAIIAWLDTFGPRAHDAYLTHADTPRFDDAPYVIREEAPGCSHIVRTQTISTVYCLLGGPYRLVFPNEATYFSWYPDYAGIQYITDQNVAEYQLIGNVTMKAGSLVKIQTDPRVYLVTDSLGTLRWITTEGLARALFGDGWATKVRDVPDAFFTDHRIGEPIE